MKHVQFSTLNLTNKMIRKTAKLFSILPLAFLCACSIFPSPAPVDIYQLPPTSFKESTTPPTKPWALKINRPNSNVQINSQRIIVVPQANLISAYQGVRWSDSAPTITRNRIVNAFITDGRIKSISSDDRSLYSDFEIDSFLQSFQTEYVAGVPQVVIRLDAQLIDSATRKVIANRRFEVIQPTADANVPQVVVAFGQATDKLTSQLIDWTITQAAKK